MDHIRFSSLDEFFETSAESDQDFEYTMSWVDLFIGGQDLCRGNFMRGNHNQSQALASRPIKKRLPLALPFNLPTFTLNTLTIKAFNELYYHAQMRKRIHKIVPYDPFFYPLDSIHNWYRMYGKRGFLQYQFVIPFDHARQAMGEILGRIRQAGEGSFLTVLKKFGDIPSPGMLSFPRPGLTLTRRRKRRDLKYLSAPLPLRPCARREPAHRSDRRLYVPRNGGAVRTPECDCGSTCASGR